MLLKVALTGLLAAGVDFVMFSFAIPARFFNTLTNKKVVDLFLESCIIGILFRRTKYV